MKSRMVWVCGLWLAAASVLSAQMGRFSNDANGVRGSVGIPPAFPSQAITGAAYSGEEVSESVQTLSDGTHITQKNLQRKVYRDSEGRVRTERPLIPTPATANSKVEMPMVIEITDPVAGFQYGLDTQNKVAHRQALPAPSAHQMAAMAAMSRGAAMPQMVMGGGGGGTRSGVVAGITDRPPVYGPPPPPVPDAIANRPSASGEMPAPARMDAARSGVFSAHVPAPTGSNAGPMQPKFSTEQLGTQTIDGVLVEGTRSTVIYPVGLMGNDREFSSTTETWMSPELKLMVLSKSNDPRSGENTFKIANLSRTPPDANLFLVPPDYTIVDEKGGYTITYGQQ